jgi:general secretion pathway protein N
MKAAGVAIVGFVLLLAAIAAFAPASLVDRRLSATTSGKLRLSDAAGTVWNGTGILTDAAGAWRVPVGWSVSVPALARGAFTITLLPTAGASPRGTIQIATDAATLRDVVVELPATLLASALPGRAPVVLGGNLALNTSAFEWNGERGSGALNVRWHDARLVAAGTTADLGTVDITLEPQGNRLAGHIGNAGGDVRVDGTIMVSATMIGVDAEIAPLPATPPPVLRALAALGAPDSTGAVRIAWRGSPR